MKYAGLAAAVVVVFLPSLLSHEFLNWDDDRNFTQNPFFTFGALESVLASLRADRLGNFQPLAWLLLRGEVALFGFSPAVILTTNVLLHAANAALLYGLTGNVLVVLAYALHPLRVESVAWASCQPILWSTLFGLLAVRAYHREKRGFAYAFFLAALLCKPVVIWLPVLLLLRPFDRRDLGFWVLSLLFAGIALVSRDVSQSGNLALPFTVFFETFRRTLWPWGLSPIYASPSVPLAAGAVAFAAGAAIVVRRFPAVRTFALVLLASLAPQFGSAMIQGVAFADRYTYGAGMVMAFFLARLRPNVYLTGGLVAVFAVSTIIQLGIWKNTETLWRNAIARAGSRSSTAHANLAAELLARQRPEEAEPYYRRAVELDPRSAEAWNGLGVTALVGGDAPQARAHFEKALTIQPRNADAFNNLSLAFERGGDPRRALALVEKAIALAPHDPKMHEQRARLLETANRLAESAEAWRFVVDARPGDTLAVAHLGALLERLGRRPEAIRRFREAVRLAPHDFSAKYNLAVLLAADGNDADATGLLDEVLRISPNFTPAIDEARRIAAKRK